MTSIDSTTEPAYSSIGLRYAVRKLCRHEWTDRQQRCHANYYVL